MAFGGGPSTSRDAYREMNLCCVLCDSIFPTTKLPFRFRDNCVTLFAIVTLSPISRHRTKWTSFDVFLWRNSNSDVDKKADATPRNRVYVLWVSVVVSKLPKAGTVAAIGEPTMQVLPVEYSPLNRTLWETQCVSFASLYTMLCVYIKIMEGTFCNISTISEQAVKEVVISWPEKKGTGNLTTRKSRGSCGLAADCEVQQHSVEVLTKCTPRCFFG